MNRLQKFLQKRAIYDGIINKAYKDYQKFMCTDTLPDFKIEYVCGVNIGYKAQVSPFSSKITLRINIDYIGSKEFNTTLVHEFTHIFDYTWMSAQYDQKYIENHWRFYSEYHASQIEILYGYHIINNIQEIANVTMINKELIVNLPMVKSDMYVEFLKQYVDNPSFDNFTRMKAVYMYSCGALNLIYTLLGKKPKGIKFGVVAKEPMMNMRDLLMSLKYYELPTKDILDKICEYNKQANLEHDKYVNKITNINSGYTRPNNPNAIGNDPRIAGQLINICKYINHK